MKYSIVGSALAIGLFSSVSCGGKVVFDTNGDGGGAAGGTASSTSSASTTPSPCVALCAAALQAGCDTQDDQAPCVATCERKLTNLGACTSHGLDEINCSLAQKPFTCFGNPCKDIDDSLKACVLGDAACDGQCGSMQAPCTCISTPSCANVYKSDCVSSGPGTDTTCTCRKDDVILGTCTSKLIPNSDHFDSVCDLVGGCCSSLFENAFF